MTIIIKKLTALALLLFLLPAASGATSPLVSIRGTITTENLVDLGACTTGGCVETQVATAGAVTVQVTGTYTATGGLSAQITNDGTNWITLGATTTFTRQSTGATSATITSGQQDIYRVDVTGARRFRVTALGAVTGTATVTIQPVELSLGGGTTTGGTDGVAQGSTTSGQSGPLAQGAVTTSSPSYTNAQTSPLSLDTSGNLRVNVVAGGAGGGNVTGGTAHDAAGAAVNPVLDGCYASAAAPSDVSADNDATRAWCLRNGARATAPTFAGIPAVAGNGASGTGVQRVTIASDSTGQVALAAGSATIGALTANQSVNVAQMNGVATSMGAGVNGTGVQRVTIATDDAMSTAIVGVAHDAAGGSVNPALTGCYASAAAPTDVSADTDATRSWCLRNGARAIQPTYAGVLGVTGNGTAGTGTPRGTIASDNSAIALWGHGATGSAVPANATFMGGRTGANTHPIPVPDTTAKIDVSTATTVEIVALTASQKIWIGSFSILAGGTGNIKFVTGTGTNCGTGTTDLTGNYNLTAQNGVAQGAGLGAVLVVPSGSALCVTTSAAVQMSGHVTYTKF